MEVGFREFLQSVDVRDGKPLSIAPLLGVHSDGEFWYEHSDKTTWRMRWIVLPVDRVTVSATDDDAASAGTVSYYSV